MYHIEGLSRWNEERAAAALDAPRGQLRSFDYSLRSIVNELSKDVFGEDMVGVALPFAEYIGEKIGVQYLLQQTGQENLLPEKVTEDDPVVEQGLDDTELDDDHGAIDRNDSQFAEQKGGSNAGPSAAAASAEQVPKVCRKGINLAIIALSDC